MVDSANRTVDDVAGEIRKSVARLTGELAASVAVEHAGPAGPIEASLTVGTDEPGEAAAVEFGTAHQVPQPFFRPAVNHAVPAAKADMRRSVRDSIP